MRLTRTTVDSIKLHHGKTDVIIFDDDLPGFGLRIRAGGSRTWVVQYEQHGQQRRVTIGSIKLFSLEEARKIARTTLAKAHLGQDPQEEKRKAKELAKVTLRSGIDRYLEWKGPKLRPKSRREIDRYLLKHWKPLHAMPIHQIERRHVAAHLGGAPVAAGQARSALSALFAWAMTEGLGPDVNPVVGTRRPDEDAVPRSRVLDTAELVTVWRACGDDDYGRIIKLLALAGCRRQEIGGMKWSELDRERGTWTIPPERSKNKRAHTLALPAAAWAIIDSVAPRDGIDCLFGLKGEGFRGWWTAKMALDRRARLEPWTVHDLRRSVATGMADLGVLPHTIEAALNHVGQRTGVASIYNRSSCEREVRAALALWSDHLSSAVAGEQRKVVALRSR
jgi:integrase